MEKKLHFAEFKLVKYYISNFLSRKRTFHVYFFDITNLITSKFVKLHVLVHNSGGHTMRENVLIEF